jgi:hypothetical protein
LLLRGVLALEFLLMMLQPVLRGLLLAQRVLALRLLCLLRLPLFVQLPLRLLLLRL